MAEDKVLEDAQMLVKVWPGFERGYPAVIRVAQALLDQHADLTELRDLADSVVFHQLCCLGGCHELLASLARLARAIKYEADPATEEEIAGSLAAPHDHGRTYDCFINRKRDRAEKAETALTQAKERIAAAEAALREIAGCFEAAIREGLLDRLSEVDQEYGVGSLADLVNRRLLHANNTAWGAIQSLREVKK